MRGDAAMVQSKEHSLEQTPTSGEPHIRQLVFKISEPPFSFLEKAAKLFVKVKTIYAKNLH